MSKWYIFMGTPKQDLPDDLLAWTPLTPTVFFILMALADGPKRGYAIMKLSARLSEGRVRMGPGAVYSTIQRLVEAGLIEEAEPEEGEDPRRRVYELSRRGRSLALNDGSNESWTVRSVAAPEPQDAWPRPMPSYTQPPYLLEEVRVEYCHRTAPDPLA